MSNKGLVFTDKTVTQVKLDGKIVGNIKEVKEVIGTGVAKSIKVGWQYFPKGSNTGGEVFMSKFACMGSLYKLEQ